MRALGIVVLHWLHQVGLAVWLGGAVVLGAVAAPSVFGMARAAGDTATGDPLWDFAGVAMGEAFRRFNYVVMAAGGAALLAGIGYGLLARLCRKRVLVRAALTLAALGIAAWLTFVYYPQLVTARAAGDTATFDAFHRTYSTAFQAQMVLLFGVIALTGWMHLFRSPGAREARAE
ncbi:MAG: DUF4149 domain-containing protein [Armatimonadota bacterium]